MRKSTQLLWIAEADARQLQDATRNQRAMSESHVNVARVEPHPILRNRLRRLAAVLLRAARGWRGRERDYFVSAAKTPSQSAGGGLVRKSTTRVS